MFSISIGRLASISYYPFRISTGEGQYTSNRNDLFILYKDTDYNASLQHRSDRYHSSRFRNLQNLKASLIPIGGSETDSPPSALRSVIACSTSCPTERRHFLRSLSGLCGLHITICRGDDDVLMVCWGERLILVYGRHISGVIHWRLLVLFALLTQFV
jgi:hypothetical protein